MAPLTKLNVSGAKGEERRTGAGETEQRGADCSGEGGLLPLLPLTPVRHVTRGGRHFIHNFSDNRSVFHHCRRTKGSFSS